MGRICVGCVGWEAVPRYCPCAWQPAKKNTIRGNRMVFSCAQCRSQAFFAGAFSFLSVPPDAK